MHNNSFPSIRLQPSVPVTCKRGAAFLGANLPLGMEAPLSVAILGQDHMLTAEPGPQCPPRFDGADREGPSTQTLLLLLQDGSLGLPHSVQLGHTAPVTFLDFNKRLPSALVSSSYDGTCRLWDASCTQPAMHILQVSQAWTRPKSCHLLASCRQVANSGLSVG